MRTMSRTRQPARGFGWLLLLGGLFACGRDLPGSTAGAAGPADRSGEAPDLGDAPEDGGPETQASGALAPRFVNKGYGVAWTMLAADLDGDGAREILHAGHGVVAIGADDRPMWTFDLPSADADLRSDERRGPDAAAREPERAHPDSRGNDAEKLRWLGVHARAVQAAGDRVYVLDSANRVHVLDAATGALRYTTALGDDAVACDLALFDGDRDGVADFFPSGGTTAYSGRDGTKLFEANVSFIPTRILEGKLDAQRGRELVLLGGEPGEVCPVEAKRIAEMEAARADAEGADRPSPRPDGRLAEPAHGATFAVLDRDGEVRFDGGTGLVGVTDARILPRGGERGGGTLVVAAAGGLYAYEPDGTAAWTVPARAVDELLTADLDGDGVGEVIAHARRDDASTLSAIDATGQMLWRADLDAPAVAVAAFDLDGDRRSELLTALGASEAGPARDVAWNIGADGPEERWSVEAPVAARGFAMGSAMGIDRLYVAGGEGVLDVRAPATGAALGAWYAGAVNHAVAAGDLDGDGLSETITGDLFGNLSVFAADGARMRNLRVESEGPVTITGIAVSRGADGRGLLVASGYAWNNPDKGVLAAFDATGAERFVASAPNGLGDVKLADLDGDGAEEIVAAYYGYGSDDDACGARAYAADGAERWSAEVSTCGVGRIAVGDIDGDGASEVAYGDLGANGPFHVALLDGAGAIRFDVTSDTNDAVWLAILDGAVAYGGRAGEEAGHVTLLDPAGDERWTIDAGGAAKNAPNTDTARYGAFAGSLFGIAVGDADGDGLRDLAWSAADGSIAIVSAANGDYLLETNLGDTMGGPMAWLERADGMGTLVASGYDFGGQRSGIVAFDVEKGDVIGEMRVQGFVLGLVPARFDATGPGMSLATTYDAHGVDLRSAPVEPVTEDARDEHSD